MTPVCPNGPITQLSVVIMQSTSRLPNSQIRRNKEPSEQDTEPGALALDAANSRAANCRDFFFSVASEMQADAVCRPFLLN